MKYHYFPMHYNFNNGYLNPPLNHGFLWNVIIFPCLIISIMVTWTNTELMAWISNYITPMNVDVIIYPCCNCDFGLVVYLYKEALGDDLGIPQTCKEQFYVNLYDKTRLGTSWGTELMGETCLQHRCTSNRNWPSWRSPRYYKLSHHQTW